MQTASEGCCVPVLSAVFLEASLGQWRKKGTDLDRLGAVLIGGGALFGSEQKQGGLAISGDSKCRGTLPHSINPLGNYRSDLQSVFLFV